MGEKNIKTHSYLGSQYIIDCLDYDFTSKTIEAMEVHIGKWNTTNLECGMCEASFETLQNLEIHDQWSLCG